MPHFGIESLGHGLGGFLTGTTTDTGQTITGQSVSPQVSLSESFQSSLNIFSNILSGGELPETFRESVTTQNLLGLGQASIDISQALNEQITIREQQLARTQESIRNQQLFTESVNERLSGQVTQLGQSLTDLVSPAGAPFDPLKAITDNPFLGGLSTGALLAGAGVLAFLLLRR